ncbi:hypothetical protein SAMN05443549_102266 [Flavobacterium fluvii]|uniref:Uncharacterized protein n=1 Tax=Flavobacterium fluvii TaxID=468056 RepID=A0A1M5HJV8_9FLAO|nr:hypothetical protein [Flavobacterium fluvii]SHG16244.1 hypothetical protein SAMN05443549_102266 [Flavobacterium fluvii]
MKKPIIVPAISKLLKSKTGRISALLFIISYFFIILASTGVFDHFSIEKVDPKMIIQVVSGVFLIISLALMMFSYLEGRYENPKEELNPSEVNEEKNLEGIRKVIDEFNYILKRQEYENKENFDALSKKLQETSNMNFHIDDEKIKKLFIDNINSDFFKELNINLTKEISSEKRSQINQLISFNGRLKERILEEISKLDRKSNINLIIGSFMTMIALFGLGYIVFTDSEIKPGIESILLHYLPRISFIVFIEIFAFFFLKLYKLNINDVKYYQNELTNIELKFTSLYTAINFGKDRDLTFTNQKFADTERNFIIQKGQTTVELEKLKNENYAFEKFAKVFKGVLRK